MKTTHESKPLLCGFAGLLVGTIATSLAMSSFNHPPIAFPANTTTSPSMAPMMGDADQRFIVMMIPHHQDAIAMSDLALERSQRPEIQTLAKAIKQTQTQEIKQMQDWYKQWYGIDAPEWISNLSRGTGHGMGKYSRWQSGSWSRLGWTDRNYQPASMMQTDLAALESASDFDREFLREMIPHHQMAVMMSTMLINRGNHPELIKLAQSMIKSQSREIEQMQQWYDDWYSSPPKPLVP